jgi:predicted dehydrogenase
VRLGVGFHLRLHPVHAAMRELIGREGVGDVVLAQALWGFYSAHWSRDSWKMDPRRAGAGSLAGLGVHLIDLLRFLTGREVAEVVAVADGPDGERPVEFLTAATLAFTGGSVAQLVSSRRLRNTDDTLTVYCEQARLRGIGTLTTEPVGRLEIVREAGSEVHEPELRDLYVLEIEACSAAIRDGGDFPATAADGVRSVEILAAVLESARSGRAVSPESAVA